MIYRDALHKLLSAKCAYSRGKIPDKKRNPSFRKDDQNEALKKASHLSKESHWHARNERKRYACRGYFRIISNV